MYQEVKHQLQTKQKALLCDRPHYCSQCDVSFTLAETSGIWSTVAHCPICGVRCYERQEKSPGSIQRFMDMRFARQMDRRKLARTHDIGEGIQIRLWDCPILSRNSLGNVRWDSRYQVEVIDTEYAATLPKEDESSARVGNCLWEFVQESEVLDQYFKLSGGKG